MHRTLTLTTAANRSRRPAGRHQDSPDPADRDCSVLDLLEGVFPDSVPDCPAQDFLDQDCPGLVRRYPSSYPFEEWKSAPPKPCRMTNWLG